MRVMRDAYELRELADFWCISNADIRCLVGQGRLRLCVRIVEEPAVCHARTDPSEGAPVWAPVQEGVFSGLGQLAQTDAFGLLRDGEKVVTDVYLAPDRCLALHGGDGLRFRIDDLLVARDHADLVQRDIIGVPAPEADAFDFRLFVYDNTEYAFTLPQARALEYMLDQTRAGVPDQHYADILNAVGSASQRLSSLFSRKPHWQQLIRKTPGRRGWYHLEPHFVIWLVTSS